ncbi:MAG: peptidase M48 Ste24p [Rhodobacteraceae bacterium]|nr:peptidase M48 Ste24p [Paracoccaceae bacterium]
MSGRQLIGKALFLDGEAAIGAPCSLWLDDAAGEMVFDPQGVEVKWPYPQIRKLPDQAGQDRKYYTQAGEETKRLLVFDADRDFWIRARARNMDKRAPVRKPSRVIGWAMAAVSSVALIIFVLVPVMADQLAGFLPPSGEKALGDATLGQIRSALDQTGLGEVPTCESSAGVAALAKMEQRIFAETDIPVPLTVHVLDHELVNAFALPGGHIVLFRGLIDEAENPEEIAAVFAHEMGHVAARDPTRIALRSAGSIGVLGLLFGDFAGGAVVLFLAERLIQADYTREAEANADSFAHQTLLAADIPPEGIATFFERLQAEEGSEDTILAHWASHPELGDRVAAARDAMPSDFVGTAILDPQEWDALKHICDRRSRTGTPLIWP